MTAASTQSINPAATQASRTPILAVAGVAASAVLTAIGTFGDITGNDHHQGSQVGAYLASVGIAVVGAALVFRQDQREPGRGAAPHLREFPRLHGGQRAEHRDELPAGGAERLHADVKADGA